MHTLRRMAIFFKQSIFLVTLSLLFIPASQAQISPPDVGLVTKVLGEATYWNKNDQKDPVQVQGLMKVRQGDYFKLSPGAVMQLLYSASGQQETWRGPVIFSASEGESIIAQKQPAPHPEVKILPAEPIKRIIETPIPLPRSHMRYAGAIPSMGDDKCAIREPAPASISPGKEVQMRNKETEKVYHLLRKQTRPDDLTPELYLLSVKLQCGHYQDMEKVIDAMLRKQPDNATLNELKDWAASKSLSKGQPAPLPRK